MSSLVVEYMSKCSRGRKFNRDFHIAEDAGDQGLFVAVGSTYGRDESTDTTIQAIKTCFRGSDTPPQERVVGALRAADEQLAHLNDTGDDDDDWRWDFDSASAVVAGFTDSTVYVAWVGLCRAYLVREGLVRAVTQEHSLLQDYRAAKGTLSPEEERAFPHPDVMTRALGVKPTEGRRVEIDMNGSGWEFELGDSLVLGTQGIYFPLSNDEIAPLATRKNPAKALVDAAWKSTKQAATALVVGRSGARLPTARALVRE